MVRRFILQNISMQKNLTPQQNKLIHAMIEISEKCYCAGWLRILEYVLWHALKTGDWNYGRGKITNFN